MELQVIYDPEFSINYVDCDTQQVDIEVYDDGCITIEINPYYYRAIFTSAQLRMLADYADRLREERSTQEGINHEP